MGKGGRPLKPRTCIVCGKTHFNRHAKTCGTNCAVRAVCSNVREMRNKDGDLYERWFEGVARAIDSRRLYDCRGVPAYCRCPDCKKWTYQLERVLDDGRIELRCYKCGAVSAVMTVQETKVANNATK